MNTPDLSIGTPIACKDCVHFDAHAELPPPQHPGFCSSPQLQPHLDRDIIGSTYAGAVRDLAALCGYEARWFRARGGFTTIYRGPCPPGEKTGHARIAQDLHTTPPEQRVGNRCTADTARSPEDVSLCSFTLKVTLTIEPTTGQDNVIVSTVMEAPFNVND